MLHIYIGKENLPKDMFLIIDADAAFGLVDMSGTDFQKRVIRGIDGGSYGDQSTFVDRFGRSLYYTHMSTGAKALCLLESTRDKIVNFSECGENALRLLSYLDEGHIYLDGRESALPWDVDYAVVCNGRHWDRVSLLNDMLR